MQQYNNNEKVEQQGFEEVISFCIEEGIDISDGWCINAQNWYRKG